MIKPSRGQSNWLAANQIKRKFVVKNDPELNKHRIQEKSNAYLKLLRLSDKKGRRRDKYAKFTSQMDVAEASTEVENTYATTKDITAEDARDSSNHMVIGRSIFDQSVSIDSRPMTIPEFLAKPYKVLNFSITKSTFSDSFNIGGVIFDNPLWVDKLQGYLGFRGTVVLRFQINSQPFLCGRAIITHEPMYNDMKFEDGTSSAHDHSSDLILRTQLPRVEIDYATESQVVMKIPYNTLLPYFNLITGQGDWGRIRVSSYLPLRGPDANPTIDTSLWMSFEDVELAAPCAFTSQMDTDGEKKPGPIEKAMGTVQSVSTVLQGVPYVSTVAKPVAWAANIAKSVCSIFGWSKPLDTTQVTRVFVTDNQYYSNCSGHDNAFNTGLQCDNIVEYLPKFGNTECDEMSIDFIKQQWAYINTFTVSTSQPTDTLLYTIDVSPANMGREALDDNVFLTPVAGLANCFTFWRGDLEFKFKFAKTIYHRARFYVVFSPNANLLSNNLANPTDYTGQNVDFLHRTVFDISETNEFTFKVPYCSTNPYSPMDISTGRMQLYVLNSLVSPTSASDIIDCAVEVRGLPSLEFAVPTIPKYVPLGDIREVVDTVVEALHFHNFYKMSSKGGVVTLYNGQGKGSHTTKNPVEPLPDGMYFSRPNAIGTEKQFKMVYETSTDPRTYTITYIAADETELNPGELNSAQNITIVSVDPTDFSDIKSDSFTSQMDTSGMSQTVQSVDHAKYCVGEKILSVKQLMNRTNFHTTRTVSGNAISITRGGVTENFQRPLDPGEFSLKTSSVGFADMYTYFASIYAYLRGGVVIRTRLRDGSPNPSITMVPSYDRRIRSPGTHTNYNIGYLIENEDHILSYYVPQYGTSYGRLSTRTQLESRGCGVPFCSNTLSVYSDSRFELMGRSAAEDTQFGFFLGFPKMMKNFDYFNGK